MATAIDYFGRTTTLEVVDVHRPGNKTGWVTPPALWNPALGHAPRLNKYLYWFDHGTAGSNTLAFWGNGGSANDLVGWTLAQLLIPHDTTVFKDGKVHDTVNTVFKMVPDGFTCNHTGDCVGPFNNTNSRGMEYESRQDGTSDITDNMLIKGALIYAHDVVQYGIPDWFRLMHGIVAENPWGRRTDPFAGLFDIARSWEHVQAIRRDPRIWAFWGLPQPHIIG